MKRSLTRSMWAFGAAAAFAAAPSAAHAQPEVTFTGTTTGMFLGSGNAMFQGLTFAGGSFNVTTAMGYAGIGDTGPAGSLGILSLANNPDFNYTGQGFELTVNFTAPTGTSPSSQMFSATLIGAVSNANDGGVRFDFDQTPMMFTFDGGTFTFVIDDVTARTTGDVPITGFIQATTVPEPGTVILLGSGLVALAGFGASRRRRNNA